MIHYRENCTCKTFHPLTDICTECSHHNHYAFTQHAKNGTDSLDEDEQKLLVRLRTEPNCKLRVGLKRHSGCGHVGVWQGSACAICAQKRRDRRIDDKAKTDVGYIESVRQQLSQVKENIDALKKQEEMLQNIITLTEMGIDVGRVTPLIRVKSPRQQAIADGKRWYIPYEPCKHCNTIAERYVANGKCRNCGR